MHIYNAGQLSTRNVLPPGVALFFDYWFFLNAQSSPPLWAARPLAVNDLRLASLSISSGHDAALQRAVQQEWIYLGALASHIPGLQILTTHAGLAPGASRHEWTSFQKVLDGQKEPLPIAHLTESLTLAIVKEDLFASSMLIRRMSAELSRSSTESKRLYLDGLSAFAKFPTDTLAKNATRALQDVFAKICREGPVEYKVTVPFAPTLISKRTAEALRHKRTLLLEPVPMSEAELTLSGVTFSISALTPNSASEKALDSARLLLETLRLTYYVRTHIVSAVEVQAPEDGQKIFIALPQPFWNRTEIGVRIIPRPPKLLNKLLETFDAHTRRRWSSARSHLSQAIADWPEHIHSAVAHIWQALESFTAHGHGHALQRVQALGLLVSHRFVLDTTEWIGTRLTQQSHVLRETEEWCNWLQFHVSRGSAAEWLRDAFTLSHVRNWRNWQPVAPHFLFARGFGVLDQAAQALVFRRFPEWTRRRMSSDFALMYALRNRMVHSGETLFSCSFASYLGKLGIESLLAAMNIEAQSRRVPGASSIIYRGDGSHEIPAK